MSEQFVAAASQKFTSPAVTAEPPAFTVAVNVTTVPWETELTTAPFEVIAKLVDVDAAAQPRCAPPQSIVNRAATRNSGLGSLTCAFVGDTVNIPVKRGNGVLMATLLHGTRRTQGK
jgi:hypothetical protein